jgi:hypothetical protein
MVNRFLAGWLRLPITLCRMDATAQSLESPGELERKQRTELIALLLCFQ